MKPVCLNEKCPRCGGMWSIFEGDDGHCMTCGIAVIKEVGMPFEEIGRDGFESGFYFADDPYTGEKEVNELNIPVLWSVDWVQGMNDNVRPEWKARDKKAGQKEVIEGRYAAGVHHSFAKYQTVLYRHVDAEVGAEYRMDAYVLGDAHPDSGFATAIGIDPYGGTDWGSEDVAWKWYALWDSDWENGTFRLKSTPIVTAQSTRITLYLRAWARFAANAAAVFDDTRLYSSESTKPPPEPGQGVTREEVVKIVSEMVPGMIKMYAPKVIIDKLSET